MKRTVLLILCFVVGKQFSFAQLCTGSLGDPIVNFTFGNSSSPLNAGVTNMQFTTVACPNDGQYTVINKTSNCFGGSWHTLNADHTGDANGQFMLVNASITPNDFYVDTVKGLCSNTTFEFAAWIANVQIASACNGNPIRPNLTFRIETTAGVELVKYNTGDIASTNTSPQWNQYGTFFKTPQGVSTVVLRITNNATGGCGNDLALDDITFRPCGPTISTTVRNQPPATVTVCEGDPAAFILDAGSSAGFAGSTIQWQVSTDAGKTWTDIAGAQSVSYTRTATVAGSYQYRVVVAETANFASVQCRVSSTVSNILVSPTPVFVAKTFIPGCTSADVQFQTVTGNGYTYQWTGPNNFTSTVFNPILPKVVYADSGLYQVLVTTAAGCKAIDSFNLKVFQGVTASVNASTLICEGANTTLLASGGTQYQWVPSTNLSNAQIANPVASPLDTTVYKVIVSNQFGCKDSALTIVNVLQNPVVNAGADKKIFEGQSVSLDGSIVGNMSSFFWSPSSFMNNPNSLTPTVNPADTITYTLVASPGSACPVVTDNVFVLVYKKLTVPNAFSPNGDGINDTWVITGLETYPESILRVYSRNGALVYQSKGNSIAWDGTYQGKPLPVATYYYTIDLNTGAEPISGWVVILR